MTNDLTAAIDDFDFPGLLAELYPASQATPNRAGQVRAVWRGERNASAYIYQHPQSRCWLLKDHGTGEVWNAYQFLTGVEGMSHGEAADTLGVETEEKPKPPPPKVVPPVEAQVPLPEPPVALSGRGFVRADLELYGIVNDGGDALIPLMGVDGQLYNVKRKLAEPRGKMRYKYEYEGHGAPCWFSPGFLESNAQLWVEGELNGMIAHSVLRQHDANIAVAGIPGAEAHLPDITMSGKAVYLYADNDAAGRRLQERFPQWALDQGAKSVTVLDAEERDFCDVAGEDGRDALHSWLGRAIQKPPTLTILDREVHDGYTLGELRDIGRKFIDGELLLPSGYLELDSYTGGFPETGVIEVGALPSFGKSIFMRDVCTYQALHNNRRVLHFSPDQSIPSIVVFLASKMSRIPASMLRSGIYPARMLEEYGGPEAIRKTWGEVYDHCLLRLSQNYRISEAGDMRVIRKRVLKALDEGYSFFAADYAQILEYYDDRGREVDGRAINEIKKMTRELKIPFLVALQLAKYKFPQGSKRDPLPYASDIEGRGSYYQAAEQLYMIWDHELYEREYAGEETPWPADVHYDAGKVRIYVRKNKMGPWGDWRYLRKQPELGTFLNMTEEGSGG